MQERLNRLNAEMLTTGSKVDEAAAIEEANRRAQAVLAQKKLEEKRLAKELAENEEVAIGMQQDYANMHEEAQAKTVKLKKLYLKYASFAVCCCCRRRRRSHHSVLFHGVAIVYRFIIL